MRVSSFITLASSILAVIPLAKIWLQVFGVPPNFIIIDNTLILILALNVAWFSLLPPQLRSSGANFKRLMWALLIIVIGYMQLNIPLNSLHLLNDYGRFYYAAIDMVFTIFVLDNLIVSTANTLKELKSAHSPASDTSTKD